MLENPQGEVNAAGEGRESVIAIKTADHRKYVIYPGRNTNAQLPGY
jgi:hypothetical protein